MELVNEAHKRGYREGKADQKREVFRELFRAEEQKILHYANRMEASGEKHPRAIAEGMRLALKIIYGTEV